MPRRLAVPEDERKAKRHVGAVGLGDDLFPARAQLHDDVALQLLAAADDDAQDVVLADLRLFHRARRKDDDVNVRHVGLSDSGERLHVLVLGVEHVLNLAHDVGVEVLRDPESHAVLVLVAAVDDVKTQRVGRLAFVLRGRLDEMVNAAFDRERRRARAVLDVRARGSHLERGVVQPDLAAKMASTRVLAEEELAKRTGRGTERRERDGAAVAAPRKDGLGCSRRPEKRKERKIDIIEKIHKSRV